MASKKKRKQAAKRRFVSNIARAHDTCGGKKVHTEKWQALEVMDHMISTGSANLRTLRVYRCEVCRNWHIGNITLLETSA